MHCYRKCYPAGRVYFPYDGVTWPASAIEGRTFSIAPGLVPRRADTSFDFRPSGWTLSRLRMAWRSRDRRGFEASL